MIQSYDIGGGIIHEGVYEFYVKNIKINLDGSLWGLQSGTQLECSDFTVNNSQIYKKMDCMSVVSTIDNKPGMLPNYINLLSKVDSTATVSGWLDPLDWGTLKENHVIVSNDLLSHISSIDGISYDLKFTPSGSDTSPLFLRFGFESKTDVPSVGYIIFIELNN